MATSNGGKFANAMSSGLAASVAWGVVLIVYVTFRAFKIDDPALGNAFLLLTGAWVSALTLAQGKKNAKVEETAVAAKETTERVERKIDAIEHRADASEQRESEWSKHRDHTEDRRDE